MSKESIDFVHQLYNAFGRGDIPAVMEGMDVNIEWIESEAVNYPFNGLHRGPEGVATGVFERIPATYEDFAVKPQDFVEAGDRVIVIGEYTGRGKTTGKVFNSPFVHVMTVQNNKITRFQVYTDTAIMTDAAC